MPKFERWNSKKYKEYIKKNKGVFAVYILLRAVVIFAMVWSCIRGNYENLFYCSLALVLFLVPAFRTGFAQMPLWEICRLSFAYSFTWR